MRIGIVAGESSGDLLGAGLIRAIHQQHPEAQFDGIAGPQMIAQGAQSLFPMDRLAVMGLTEVLGRYRELARIRRELLDHFIIHQPDVVIGIDAPDFNLWLEAKLRLAGVKTVHYVSPSVWAWRQYRIKKISRSADLMLTLFPFEAAFYEKHHMPVRFVGHPLADMIPLQTDSRAAKTQLGLPPDKTVIALLPGSRAMELNYLAERFVKAAKWCAEREPGLHFVSPQANPARRIQFEDALEKWGEGLSISLLDGQSREAMAAADVVLLASGTATLEALLLKKPMVVGYCLSPITYTLVKLLATTPYFSLPNLLAGEQLVPEILQKQATPENLGRAVLDYLQNPIQTDTLKARFLEIHETLRQDASQQAAQAILELIANGAITS